MLRCHLYYGNGTGDIGTLLTCFPYPGDVPGRLGKPQIGSVGFVVPPDSSPYWVDRLDSRGVDVEGPERRFDETVLRFEDPAETRVELVRLLAGRLPRRGVRRAEPPEVRRRRRAQRRSRRASERFPGVRGNARVFRPRRRRRADPGRSRPRNRRGVPRARRRRDRTRLRRPGTRRRRRRTGVRRRVDRRPPRRVRGLIGDRLDAAHR